MQDVGINEAAAQQNAKNKQRLKDLYNQTIVPKLITQFKYKNKHEVPQIEKIVINRGIGDASQNQKNC